MGRFLFTVNFENYTYLPGNFIKKKKIRNVSSTTLRHLQLQVVSDSSICNKSTVRYI